MEHNPYRLEKNIACYTYTHHAPPLGAGWGGGSGALRVGLVVFAQNFSLSFYWGGGPPGGSCKARVHALQKVIYEISEKSDDPEFISYSFFF